MPTFTFACKGCGASFDQIVASARTTRVKCSCGRRAKKQFSPTRALKVAEWCKTENDDSNTRHRLSNQRPEALAKIRSGAWEHDANESGEPPI